jgi:chorismate dehydratase
LHFNAKLIHVSDTPPAPTKRLRVGTVPYLVARPLDLGLENEPGIELTRAVPAELVASLRSGELDVALVSSIELFRQPGYSYLPDLAVAAFGHISSVLLFHHCPLKELRSVALDPASRAARALLQIVLNERGVNPEWVDVPSGEDPREAGCDGWLRIGDIALKECVDPTTPEAFCPSAAWRDLTGLPFPYAVWIVRQGVDITPHLDAFSRARSRGASSITQLVEMGAKAWELAPEFVHTYLAQESRYQLGAELPLALRELRDRAAKIGLCELGHDPSPIEAINMLPNGTQEMSK